MIDECYLGLMSDVKCYNLAQSRLFLIMDRGAIGITPDLTSDAIRYLRKLEISKTQRGQPGYFASTNVRIKYSLRDSGISQCLRRGVSRHYFSNCPNSAFERNIYRLHKTNFDNNFVTIKLSSLL